MSKTLILKSIVASTALITASANVLASDAYTRCKPGPAQISIFEHSHFTGKCRVLGIDEYNHSHEMGLKNDSISSIKLGSKNVVVFACRNASEGLKNETARQINNSKAVKKIKSVYNTWGKYSGQNKIHKYLTKGISDKAKSYVGLGSRKQKCEYITESIADLKRSDVGNDSISYALVFKPDVVDQNTRRRNSCTPKRNSSDVALYNDSNFKGKCQILGPGDYPKAFKNFKNDAISSIEFGLASKAEITVCEHKNFGGKCSTLTRSHKSLKSTHVGNDRISSITIRRKD